MAVNGSRRPSSGRATSPPASDGGTTTTASSVSTGTAASGAGTVGPGTTVSSGTAGTTPPASSTSTTASTTTTTAPLNPPAGPGAYGYVTAGPTCPVEQAGRPCPPRPVSAEVDARSAAGTKVASTRSDSSGRYALALPAGDYTLVVVISSGFPRCPDTPVSVRAGAPTRADISCDTEIR